LREQLCVGTLLLLMGGCADQGNFAKFQTDTNEQLSHMQKEIKEFQDRLSQKEKRTESLTRKLEFLKEDVSRRQAIFRETLKGSNLKAFQAMQNQIETDIHRLQIKIDGVNTQITEYQTEQQDRLVKLEEDLTQTKETLEENQKKEDLQLEPQNTSSTLQMEASKTHSENGESGSPDVSSLKSSELPVEGHIAKVSSIFFIESMLGDFGLAKLPGKGNWCKTPNRSNREYDLRNPGLLHRMINHILSGGRKTSAVELTKSAKFEFFKLTGNQFRKNELFDRFLLAVLYGLFESGAEICSYDHAILFRPVKFNLPLTTKYLIDKGGDVNGREKYNAPLTQAVEYGHQDIADLLLKNGARPLAESMVMQIKFVRAATQGNIEKMESEMAKGADPNGQNHRRDRALMESVKTGSEEGVKFLLEKGADPNLALSGREGSTPLFYIASKNKEWFVKNKGEKIIQLLLEAGAHVSVKNNKGRTPLHEAAIKNNEIAVKLLLEAGAKVEPRDDDGKTPLDYAEAGEVIKSLKEFGATENARSPKFPF